MDKRRSSNAKTENTEFTLGKAIILAIISFGIYRLLFVKNQ